MAQSKVTAFHHVGVTVSDMTRALTFFRDILGATITEPALNKWPALDRIVGIPDARIVIAFATVQGVNFELLQYLSPDGRGEANARPCDAGHIHVGLFVEGIEEMVERMRAAGFQPAGPVQGPVGSRGVKAIYTCGFDNLVIELIENPIAPQSEHIISS